MGHRETTMSSSSSVIRDLDEEEAAGHGDQWFAPLTEEWKKSVRPYIDLVDKLREFGLDEDIKLPAVAVIGDQSSGKSSTLEAISGVQLPRGTGIVTRCPLEMRLKSTPPEGVAWQGKLFYKKEGQSVEKELSVPEDVEEAIREAQVDLAGTEGISEELLHLEIESSSVPDLTLIDLPGIVRLAVKGQQQGLGVKIKKMICDRIKKDETIILAVIPANVDVATTEALTMAEEVDPDKSRTLGVITKPDLVDRGAEDQLVKLANNETYPLDKGFSVVKCRNQASIDDKQSLQESLSTEQDFFDAKDHFRQIEQQKLGIPNLSRKLSLELVRQIEQCFPRIEDQVLSEKFKADEMLQQLGIGVPREATSKKIYLIKLLKEFGDKVIDECHGTYQPSGQTGLKAFTAIRDYYTKLRQEISKLTPAKEELVAKIQREKNSYRGRELPGFINYSLFEGNVKEILHRYKKPAAACLNTTCKQIDHMLDDAAKQVFTRYPALLSKVKALSRDVSKRAKEQCSNRIEEIFEMEDQVYTQDKIFLYDLDLTRKNEAKKEEQKEQGTRTPGFHLNADEAMSFPAQLMGHLTSIFVPETTDEATARKEAEQIHTLLRAYLEVCTRRLIDTIPMCITVHMLQRLAKEVNTNAYALATEEGIYDVFREDRFTNQRRIEIEARLERLSRAEEEITAFHAALA